MRLSRVMGPGDCVAFCSSSNVLNVLYHILGLYIPHMHRAKHALHERFLSVPSIVEQTVPNKTSANGWALDKSRS